jgi:hypothetical protein
MDQPSAEAQCLICGRRAVVVSAAIAEGVITVPTPRCATCPGYPEMTLINFQIAEH